MLSDPFDPVPGVVEDLRPDLSRILAPNPSPMTHRGTNTYLLGTDSLAVIDPGPESPSHFDAILSAIAQRSLTHIFVTHSHLDHSPLAKPLAEATGATIIAFGDSYSGQSRIMRHLAKAGLTDGGEGVDRTFKPDVCLADGEAIAGDGWSIRAVHTPGHMGNHLCFATQDILFSGDLVMGWASSLVSPPDGDLTDFMQSCRKLQGVDGKVFYPGHGAPIDDPQGRLEWLINHRNQRTEQVLNALRDGPSDIPGLTLRIYTDAPPGLLAAAARNVFAHLVDLHERGLVTADPGLSLNAQFALNTRI